MIQLNEGGSSQLLSQRLFQVFTSAGDLWPSMPSVLAPPPPPPAAWTGAFDVRTYLGASCRDGPDVSVGTVTSVHLIPNVTGCACFFGTSSDGTKFRSRSCNIATAETTMSLDTSDCSDDCTLCKGQTTTAM